MRFRFAKTMAQIPHWYVVRGPEDEAEYVKLFRTIAMQGIIGKSFRVAPTNTGIPAMAINRG